MCRQWSSWLWLKMSGIQVTKQLIRQLDQLNQIEGVTIQNSIDIDYVCDQISSTLVKAGDLVLKRKGSPCKKGKNKF